MNNSANSDMPDRKELEPEILEPEILNPEMHEPGAFQSPEPGYRPPHYVSAGKPFPWGCLIGGCLTMVLLMVGSMVAIGFGSVWFYNQQVANYTSEQARPIPVVEVNEEQLEQLESRVEAFQEKVDVGDTPEQLVLTADDVNALISKEENLRGKVFVKIEDGLVQADVSIPANAIPGGKGRFFNGSATLEASLENGVLIVTLQDAEVNGQSVPEDYMREIRKENLAKEMVKDPDVAKKLRKFESLVIEGDKIILTPRQDSSEAQSMEDGATSEEPVPSDPVQAIEHEL